MKVKARLPKPHTQNERLHFVVKYNHQLGLMIEETESELTALEYTQEELEQQEKERIALLKLTKREVFLGLYQAKGVTPEMIKAQITDPMALIEFEYANDYYRGNPLIDVVGNALGITSAQLDKFFETNDYTCLLPIEEPEQTEDLEATEETELDEETELEEDVTEEIE